MMARLRLFLVLGRVSNGPTVWSNCLAAWWLSGGGPWKRFTWLGTGVTLLYIAGMFLNDACDAAFDRRYRPERPIPAGRISRRAVWGLGLAGLLLGWLVLLPLGASVAAWAGVLVGLIVLYDLVHKRTRTGPLLMACCRILVYVVAAAATAEGPGRPMLWRALALGAYINGLSYLARSEAAPWPAGHWAYWRGRGTGDTENPSPPPSPHCMGRGRGRTCRGVFAMERSSQYVLPAAPAVVALVGEGIKVPAMIASAVFGAWLAWCLAGKRVGGLLAGVALVDWVAAANRQPGAWLAFVGLFLLALALQRTVPAT